MWSQFLTNTGRPVHKFKHYFPIYERHFAPFVNRSVTMLEIGCGEGGSLPLWKRYFGPHATIVGIDINPACAAFEEDQISIRIGSQDDPALLQRLLDEFGQFDIVLDDGSHVMQHISQTFRMLYPTLSKNGVYVVEDLHTAYWPRFGGMLGNPNSFIEIAKGLIDELNADHIPAEDRAIVASTEFTRTTHSICFYDSVVVFERGLYTGKSAPKIGSS